MIKGLNGVLKVKNPLVHNIYINLLIGLKGKYTVNQDQNQKLCSGSAVRHLNMSDSNRSAFNPDPNYLQCSQQKCIYLLRTFNGHIVVTMNQREVTFLYFGGCNCKDTYLWHMYTIDKVSVQAVCRDLCTLGGRVCKGNRVAW